MATATDPKLTRHPSILDAVRGLAPKITAGAAETEAARRLPADLIRDLTNHLGLPVHPRFVQSRTQPPDDLDERVMDDLSTPAFTDGYHTWIYDRHPLISELIYGPIVRGHLLGGFQYPSWVDRMLAKLVPRVVRTICW